MNLLHLKRLGRNALLFAPMPKAAKIEAFRDLKGLPESDPGPTRSVGEAVNWLTRAQDHSISRDGGVARHYSLLTGWGPSYPETTGYIIPTLIKYADENDQEDLINRANRMLDWLVAIQFKGGGFKAGTIDSKPAAPTPFNTGQILLGLVEGVRVFGNRYKKPMKRAADWLVKIQDQDGCWRKFPTPFAVYGEKTYDTHVAWGLLEAADVDGNEDYFRAGMSNVRWALKHQRGNGWFEKCCLIDPARPLSHTIGYVFRGLLEAYLHSRDPDVLAASVKLADGLLRVLREDGSLPGRIGANWNGVNGWVCLTGSAQIACCWFLMYELSQEKKYLDAALSVNKYLRRTQRLRVAEETRGAIKGSFPIFGDYGRYEYLSWAAKFFIDSNMLEMEIVKGKMTDDGRQRTAKAGAFAS